MVHLFSREKYMIVLCNTGVPGLMLDIDVRWTKCNELKDWSKIRIYSGVSCWNQRLHSPYTYCQSQNIVLDTCIFLPICRLALKKNKHTYQRLWLQSSAGSAVHGRCSWAKMDKQNQETQLWNSDVSFSILFNSRNKYCNYPGVYLQR